MNDYPELEKRYENCDEMMRLEMNMIYSIENRAFKRRYKKDMFKQQLEKLGEKEK